MGSFDLRTISIAVVIALIVGAGAGYMVGNSPVSSLMEEKDWLDAEYDSLSLAFQSLEVELEEAEFNIIGLNRTNLILSDRYADMIFIDQENQELIQQVIDLEAEIMVLESLTSDVQSELDELEQIIKDHEATASASAHILSVYESQVLSLQMEVERLQALLPDLSARARRAALGERPAHSQGFPGQDGRLDETAQHREGRSLGLMFSTPPDGGLVAGYLG